MRRHRIVDLDSYPIRPEHIAHPFGAFGNSELEHAAANVISICQDKGVWDPFTKEELGYTPTALIEAGYLEVLGERGYKVTHELIVKYFLIKPANVGVEEEVITL